MSLPSDLKYTKSHEWSKKENNLIRVGVTDHAAKEISDVVHVELPRLGQTVQAGKASAVVESVKAAFDIYAPVSGKVVQVNGSLEGKPELVNQSPYQEGWFFAIEPSNPAEWDSLLSPSAYEESLKQPTKH